MFTRPLRAAAALGSLLAATLPAGFQATPPQASIRGTATDPAGSPISGVVAVVFPDVESRWSGPDSAVSLRRVAVSSGRFEVTGLPAGTYQLVFATEAMLGDWPAPALFSRLSSRKPLPIRLAPGESIGVDVVLTVSESDVAFQGAKMMRGMLQMVPSGTAPGARPGPPVRGPSGAGPAPVAPGAISGRVTDGAGQPLAGIQVRSMRRAVAPDGQPQFINNGAATRTDAEGRYRLTNRPPDAYVVAAEAYSMDLTGGLTMVRDAPPASPGLDGGLLGYVTTFHGGVTDPRIASVVRVATGEMRDIDIQLARRRVFDVRGSVSKLPLSSAFQWITLTPVESRAQSSTLNIRRIPVRNDGSFTIDEVPDGEYRLFFTDPSGWSEVRVRVAGRSLDGVTMALQAPMIVRGRVEFQGSASPPTITRDIRQFSVELAPAQTTIGAGFTRVLIQPDGTFAARASGPGPFRLRATASAPWVQTVGMVNGADTLDLPVPVGPDVDGAVIVFTDRPTALLVRVTDASSRPVAGGRVIVFSEEQRYWSARSRRVQLAPIASGGAAVLSNLPPGRYFVAAGPDITANVVITPELMARFKDRAQAFELSVGENTSVDVKIKSF